MWDSCDHGRSSGDDLFIPLRHLLAEELTRSSWLYFDESLALLVDITDFSKTVLLFTRMLIGLLMVSRAVSNVVPIYEVIIKYGETVYTVSIIKNIIFWVSERKNIMRLREIRWSQQSWKNFTFKDNFLGVLHGLERSYRKPTMLQETVVYEKPIPRFY